MLSPTKQILIQLLLFMTNTCLTQPGATFLSPKWKNACLKQPPKTSSSKEMQNKHKAQCIENKRLSDYIYSTATL